MAKSAKLDETLPKRGREAALKASRSESEEAIKHATGFIDTLPFRGSRLTDGQSLSWPRKGVFRDDGAPVHGVPEEIKEATSMVAGFILAKIPFDAPALSWVMLTIGHLLKDDTDLIDQDITWH